MAAAFGLVVIGQTVTATVVDHSGLLDVPANPVNGRTLLGVGQVVGGAAVLATVLQPVDRRVKWDRRRDRG